MRVVLDTNVVVSALLFRGVTGQLARVWQDGAFTPLVSKAMVEEYLRVLAYPKFGLSAEDVKSLVEHQLLAFAQPVKVGRVAEVIADDPSDNEFLACAVTGRARYLVSGDRHLLILKRYRKIPIVSVAEFLACLSEGER